NFLHNAANPDNLRRAEVTAYRHANIVRDFILSIHPAYPTIFEEILFPINVNLFLTCNAFYNGISINFYAAGGGCANSAFAPIVYHEYGHHVVQTGGSGQGQYGEGMADVIAFLINDEPKLGLGFQLDCTNGLRSAINNVSFPCSSVLSGAHFCGGALSGSVWEARQALMNQFSESTTDPIAELAVNAVLLHLGTEITPQITVDFLTLDDDDEDLFNGTPHYDAIHAGFSAHNMPAPPLRKLRFDFPTGLPDLVSAGPPTLIPVDVLESTRLPIPGTGRMHVRVGSAGPFTTSPMAEVAPSQYLAALPAMYCSDTLQFYVSSDSTDGIATDPPDAPDTWYTVVAANTRTTQIAHDFQLDPGWAVSGITTDGAWDAMPGIPIDCGRGDPTSDFDGSGRCMMTDNSVLSGCNSDVDDGVTILTSATYDLSAMLGPHMRYARWFSNSVGNAPLADTLVVEASDDGGLSWIVLETVGPDRASVNPEVDGGWLLRTFRIGDFVDDTTAQFQIRFTASDFGQASIVEAAIDAFEIFDFICAAISPCLSCVGDFDGNGEIDGADAPGFIEAVIAGTGALGCADINADGIIDAADRDDFVTQLLGNTSCP
ncbi:MAG: hypothetical protein V3T70_03630, partial [Phycisphaerae bacterium]